MLSPVAVFQDEDLAFFQENGYVLMKGLLRPDEAAYYRQECHDLSARLTNQFDATWESTKELFPETKKTVLKHCHDVQFYSAAFSKLLVDERFTDAASAVMQTPNVQLHHSKMFIKPPENGSPFPLHQDYPFFPHDRDTMIAAIFHFDDAPLEKGCVRVVPGSHKLGRLPHIETGSWHLPVDQYPIESAVPCPAEAGDVLFFSYLTIHGSGINVSNEARTTVLVQLRDPEDLPSLKVHESRGQGMMLRGINPLVAPNTTTMMG